jgi:MFS family permease
MFWAFAGIYFEDVPKPVPVPLNSTEEIELQDIPPVGTVLPADEPSKSGETLPVSGRTEVIEIANVERITETPKRRMSAPQWGVTATMCWFAMTCFFILGAWESNIPVFTGSDSPLSPFHFSPFAAGNLIALGGVCTFPFLFANVFLAKRYQDRNTLALGTSLGAAGLIVALAILKTRTVSYGSLFACWFLVALGFNLASTVTLSLLSKQLPPEWNTRVSVAIQYSNYTGRVTGAVWGGAGVKVGMLSYVGMQLAIVGIGAIMFSTLWRNLKAKTG